jgi:hypothetical protein
MMNATLRQQKFPTYAKKDFRPNLHLAAFHRGEVVRAGADTFCELLPRHIQGRASPGCGDPPHSQFSAA